jgi:hypothetical protein
MTLLAPIQIHKLDVRLPKIREQIEKFECGDANVVEWSGVLRKADVRHLHRPSRPRMNAVSGPADLMHNP